MRDNTVLHQEIAKLREELDTLRAMLRRCTVASAPEVAAVTKLMRAGLTIGESRLLMALATGLTLSRAQLLDAIGSNEDNCERTIDSHVKRARRKLPWLEIETLYGVGYAMPTRAIADFNAFLARMQ